MKNGGDRMAGADSKPRVALLTAFFPWRSQSIFGAFYGNRGMLSGQRSFSGLPRSPV